MGKKKLNKVSIIILSVVFILLIILTIYKINKNHEDKLYNVLYSKIEYVSYKCYLEEKEEMIMNEKMYWLILLLFFVIEVVFTIKDAWVKKMNGKIHLFFSTAVIVLCLLMLFE